MPDAVNDATRPSIVLDIESPVGGGHAVEHGDRVECVASVHSPSPLSTTHNWPPCLPAYASS